MIPISYTEPDAYKYLAESGENLTNKKWPFTVYEIGINYFPDTKYLCVNFVIKVHGTPSVPDEISEDKSFLFREFIWN